MTDTDAFFTQSIVGAPFSIVLGHRLNDGQARELGLVVPLDGTASRLGRIWQEQVLLQASSAPGNPRSRPGPVRLWLERHALFLAGFGLTSLLMAAGWAVWIGLTGR